MPLRSSSGWGNIIITGLSATNVLCQQIVCRPVDMQECRTAYQTLADPEDLVVKRVSYYVRNLFDRPMYLGLKRQNTIVGLLVTSFIF